MDKDIVLVYSEDWMMLYIDGKMVFQDHSIEPEDLLTILGIPYKLTGLRFTAYQDGEWDKVSDRRTSLAESRDFIMRHKEYGDDL